MPINSIESQNINNNKPSKGRRAAASLVSAAVLTPLVGTVYMVQGAHSTPRKENEKFIQHIMRDLGEDVKKRYTKFFDRLSCTKIANKVKNAKPSSLAGIWLGAIFGAFFTVAYLLSGIKKE